jgi:tetratricopeptide (TPR) repeat protein
LKFRFVISIVLLGLVSCTVPSYFSARTAAKFYDDGDYANAIRLYMKAIADRDQRAETFYWLGMSFYRHGDIEEAMLAFERSYEKDSTDVAVMERLAAANLDLDNFQKAGYFCKKAIRTDTEYVEAYNTLGHVFFEEGELDSAENYYRHAVDLSRRLRKHSLGTSLYYYSGELEAAADNGLGEISISRGSLFRALDYLSLANTLAHDWETPWFNKGRVYEALGNIKAAEIAYERTIDLAPGKTWAFKNLARMYRRLGRDSQAMTVYTRAMRVDTTDVDCIIELAELYEKKGDNSRAANLYARAVDKAPDDPDVYLRAGRANKLIGNYELAIEFLSDAVELQPQNAEAHNALGEAYRAAGDTVDAQTAFENAIDADSLCAPPLRNLGSILIKQGKESEGFQFYIRAARLGDRDAADFLRLRGILWE